MGIEVAEKETRVKQPNIKHTQISIWTQWIWFIALIASQCRFICDWILENRSKLHIGSFEINSFKDLKQLQLAKGSKHENKNYTRDASIYHLSDNIKNFSKFPTK